MVLFFPAQDVIPLKATAHHIISAKSTSMRKENFAHIRMGREVLLYWRHNNMILMRYNTFGGSQWQTFLARIQTLALLARRVSFRKFLLSD